MSLPENAVLTQAGPGGLSDLVAKDSSFLQTISPEISEPILVAFTQAGVVVFNSAAAVIAVAFVLSWFVKEIPLRTQSGVAAKAAEARLESMG
jgi:hypothetical protein